MPLVGQPRVWGLEAKVLGEPVAGGAALVQAVPGWARLELAGVTLGLGSRSRYNKI